MISGDNPSRTGRRFRIAILAETFPPNSGGVAAAHFSLGKLLSRRHEVRLFAFEDPRPSTDSVTRAIGRGLASKAMAFAASAYVRWFDARGGSSLSQRIAAAVPAVLRLNRALRDFRPDIVFVPDFCVPALALRKPEGARFIWVAHHNYSRFGDNALLPSSGWYDSFLAHRLEKRALKKCEHAVFPSRYMEKVFRETLGELPGTVIHNNVDLLRLNSLDRARERQRLSLGSASVLVYLPSAGTAEKGERYVFEIIRRLHHAHVDIRFFISGPVNPTLRAELAEAIAAGRVIAPGQLPHEDNLAMVAASDIAISPALFENFSCALLEAQSMGVPCVTFDIGGNRELIRDGETGYVVPFFDLEALIAKAIDLLKDAELRGRMGNAGRLMAARICDPSQLLHQYDQAMSAAHNHNRVPR